MPKLNIRLKELRKERELSQQELAKKIGLSKSSINMYERGEREPSIETLEAFADFFNVDIGYLIGTSNKRSSFDIIPTSKNTASGKSNYIQIPVLGTVRAGIPSDMIEDIIGFEDIPEEMVRDGSEYFGLKIKGTSMKPDFSPGDIVIVRKQSSADTDDIVIASIGGDEATVKALRREQKGIWLIPRNPEYQAMFFSNKEVASLPVCIVGVVVELRRTIKKKW